MSKPDESAPGPSTRYRANASKKADIAASAEQHSTTASEPAARPKPPKGFLGGELGEDQSETPSEGSGSEDPDDREENLVRALRRMGIKAPKHFDPKRDKNFETWLERTEFHLAVNKCPEESKTSSVLLLLDVDAFEAAKHLGIKSSTPYEETKQKLKDYFAITETKEELIEKLDLRHQGPNESIESFARDIRLIGHRAYPKGDPDLLERILIKTFTNGLRDDRSRERVLLHKPKSLTEAAQYARFSESVVRVARGHSVSASANSVNAMHAPRFSRGQRGRSTSSFQRGRFRSQSRGGFNQFSFRGRRQGPPQVSVTRNFNRRGRTVDVQPRNNIRCFNCNRFGHVARECRASSSPHFRNSGYTRRGGYTNRVSALDRRRLAPLREGGEEEATGTSTHISGCINNIPTSSAIHSPFSRNRKLSFVPGQINGTSIKQLLVDSGSPVTLIRSDLWEMIRDTTVPVEEEQEDFQGVTRDELRVIGLTKLELKIGGLKVLHPVLVVEQMAHKFILGNDFMTEYKCDIINSEGVIQFGGEKVQYNLFRSTINLICPVFCTSATTIGPHEEAVIPAMIDASGTYEKGESLLLEPRKGEEMGSLIGARVLVDYSSSVVPLLVANLSCHPIIIARNKVLADDVQARPVQNSSERNTLPDVVSHQQAVSNTVATSPNSKKDVSPIQQAMANADPTLSPQQRSLLFDLLSKHSSVFSAGPEDMGRTNLIYHKIELEQPEPIRQGLRRIPHEQISVLRSEVDKLQKMGAIEPSQSPFASPTILVKKKDGSMRLCIDYRKLNSVTKKDAHPLPRIEDIFDTLSGSKYFTTLDLAMGYHQVEVRPEDREKTAFSTPFGLFQYNVMPFGLATAPATFMRLMTMVFSGMLYSTCLAYLDDIVIFGRTFEEHLERLDLVLKRLKSANLKLKPSKCAFGKKSATFLGHIISEKGISTDPEKLKRIQEWPTPRNQNDVRSFLGYATYYRKFIRNFAKVADPLNKLLQKDHTFHWSSLCEESFTLLKKAFSDVVTLAYPNFSKPFIVDTDASDVGIGAVLSQLNTANVEQPVCYFSRSLSKPERKYAVTRKEMLALVDSLRHFRCYLLGKKFTVRTDHSALQWLRTFKEPVGQVARWIERLAEYDFDILHRPGIKHGNADALSRYPHAVSTVSAEEIWVPPRIRNDFRKLQASDSLTSVLLQWLKKAARPSADEVDGLSRDLKYYWARFDELSVVDGILGIQNYTEDGSNVQFCAIVPHGAKQEILELAHSSPVGGHFGISKTIDKLKQRFHWTQLARDVKEWCMRCPTCNRHKTHKTNRAPMLPIYTGEPFERVAMDIIGPLPRTKRENRYVLTVVDHFTKHAEAYALPDQEATTIARVFLNEFVARYGVPYVIHTDQGTNFESNLFKELCKMLGISKTRTSPYHPQCDGQVERMNRTLIELLKLNVDNPTENWDLELGLTLMAYRSAVQSSTGYTPFYLLYGREMRLPLDIIYRSPNEDKCHSEYVQYVKRTLEISYETAREKLNLSHERQKDYYDRRTHGERFKAGDSVWLWSPVAQKGVAPKFHEPWTGPFKVTKRLSDVTYEILDMARKSKKVVHFDRLKKSTVKPRTHLLSESEPEATSSSESEATDDISIGAEPVTNKQKKSNHVSRAPKVNVASSESHPLRSGTAGQAAGAAAGAPHTSLASDAPGNLRVSSRSSKGVPPSRFDRSGFLLYICFLFFCLMVGTVNASPTSPWSGNSEEDGPLIDGSILWHPWERAILLKGYQFLIVSYKVLPPRTSGGKFLCGGTYNSSEVDAPEWYLQWEREVDAWTKRSLQYNEVNVSSRAASRRRRNTESFNYPIPRVIPFRHTTKSFRTSLSASTSDLFSEQSLADVMSTESFHSTSAKISTTHSPLVIVQQIPIQSGGLVSHNQELVRSGRERTSRILCKQRLSQWTSVENNLFLSELGIDVDRASLIISNVDRLRTEYMLGHSDPGQWFQTRLEHREWLYLKRIFLNDDEEIRKIFISIVLPPLVMKVPEEWDWGLKEIVNDFTFRIKVERFTKYSDECTINTNVQPFYRCSVYPLLRLQNGRTIETWNEDRIPFRIFRNLDISAIERISNSPNVTISQCKSVFDKFREFYSNVLKRRLTDVWNSRAGQISHFRENIEAGICFEACKLHQLWPDFMTQHQVAEGLLEQSCQVRLGHLTRRLPTDLSAPIHTVVRNSHRVLSEWNCCSRAVCPLEDGVDPRPGTTWNRLGGPPKVSRVRREPLTLSAVGAAVLIGAAGGAAGGAITSFAMSSNQQSKINQEIANLNKLVGDLSRQDQNQWTGQNNINLEFLKDRDEFVQRIEETLCSASAIHTDNERTLEKSNLKLHYSTSLSSVVTALTTRRITPEIIPVSSLRKSLNVNGTLFEKDILSAYSLGRIHHNIYRLNESLVFLVIFPTPIPKMYRLYKPVVLPAKEDDGEWIYNSFVDGARLIKFENRSTVISTAGWSKEGGLVILETDLLNKSNITASNVIVPEPENGHVAVETLYGTWVRCGPNATLIKWATRYECLGREYTTVNGLPHVSLIREIDPGSLWSQSEYRRSQRHVKMQNLIEEQEESIQNRSRLVDEYMAKVKSFVALTKESTNLFSTVMDNILNLLPGSWGATLKRVFIIAGIVIAAPIVFCASVLLIKCFSLLYCCYKPIILETAVILREHLPYWIWIYFVHSGSPAPCFHEAP